MSEQALYGLVLSGGEGRRMGADKALLKQLDPASLDNVNTPGDLAQSVLGAVV
jgi:molybdopterin-guanine dinucleotide biosynthesis protein A